jgi:putative nucleotidyltransferase with HDIG domain
MGRAPNTGPTLKTRRSEVRRAAQRFRIPWQARLRAPAFGWGLMAWGAFTVIVSVVAVLTREQPLVAVGRVMNDTRTVRAAFEIADQAATERERENARLEAPWVYVGDVAVLNSITASLESLPKALADVESIESVDPGLRDQFALTPESLRAIKAFHSEGSVSEEWRERVALLAENLRITPLLEANEYQVKTAAPGRLVELRLPGGRAYPPGEYRLLNVSSQNLRQEMEVLALRSKFRESALLDAVVNRLTLQAKPTYAFDQATTAARRDAAAQAVGVKVVPYPEGFVIFRRGDVLKREQLELYKADIDRWMGMNDGWSLWGRRVGITGVMAAVALALAGYTIMFCPRIKRNPARLFAIAGLLSVMAGVACVATALDPALVALTAVAPTVFIAVILTIAYDQRVALAYGALHGVVVCTALDLSIGVFALTIAGIGAAIWQLREIRDRNSLIRMGLFTAAVLSVGMAVVGLTELPITAASLKQTAWDCGLAAFAGLFVGGLTLFILPLVEKMFDITTGMTLIELRDPRQPLLRELQIRAPGTYNHSLSVASLAEAAAEAIGANGLLAYVGALYHDIGKINKPDYFVENQTPGFNRHDKLSPAMSLLIIVGHVKDGVELAREFALPRALHHFIEAHHGTTLVEYFYHRARKQAAGETNADGSQAPLPEEIEYRYPGPKPRTKETAILMVCDAVESAARSMADPTPSRIEALVHALANKRLMDGQFDDCDLTLRELNTIVERVSKTLAAIYHGRIAYPTPAGGSGTGTGGGEGPRSGSAPAGTSTGNGVGARVVERTAG